MDGGGARSSISCLRWIDAYTKLIAYYLPLLLASRMHVSKCISRSLELCIYDYMIEAWIASFFQRYYGTVLCNATTGQFT